ncbi:hypothetical protein NXW89_24650 [Bacteroides thetaiotaomicron]|nr:hypothetical protein [Bacteroides thetaiotaomicron]
MRYAIGQDHRVAPVCILTLQRKTIWRLQIESGREKSRGETIRSGLGNMKDLSVHRHKTAPVPAGGREEHQARKCIGCLGLKRQERYTV